MADWFTPYRLPPGHRLNVGQAPSQGLVHAIDENVVVKDPFQSIFNYGSTRLWNRIISGRTALRSFELLRKEANTYKTLARRPASEQSGSWFMRRQPHGYGIAEAQSLDLRHWATHTATWQYEISALILTIVLNYLTLVVRHTRRMKHSSIHWGNGPSGERKKLERNSLRSKRRREGRYKIVPEAEVLRAAIFDGWIGTAPRRTFWEIREMVEGIIGAGDAAFSSTKKLSRYGNGLYAMVEHGHFGIALVE